MLSFCAEPKGEVAESIIQRITLALLERRYDRRWWVRAGGEYFPPPLNRPDGHVIPREKVFLRFLLQWILQLRAGTPFVQNDMQETIGMCYQALQSRYQFYKSMLLKWVKPVTP